VDILHLDGRLTIAAGHGWAQTPQVVTLNIEWENRWSTSMTSQILPTL